MKKDTLVTHAGRHPEDAHGVVNPPVYRASTVTFPTVEALEGGYAKRFDTVYYGRYGTPTTFALEEACAAIEGGVRAIATSSGLGAIAGALLAHVSAGDHLLMVDSVYQPTRRFCDQEMKRFGVETTYYDPLIGAGIADLIRPNTKLIFCESPGSLTFEVQDIPAIAQAAHARGVLVLLDNTWGTPLHFSAFTHGVDISIHAATKYIVGHSDAMLGMLVFRDEALFRRTKDTISLYGFSVGSEETYLALRGLRTLAVRLKRHEASGLALARWLQQRPEVARVLHPALPDDPGHKLWARDFTGACGLFGVVFQPAPDGAVNALLNGMRHFALGYSWGGFESLAIPTTHAIVRTARPWTQEGPSIRLHVGLEDVADLQADLEDGLERFNAARKATWAG